MHGLYIEVPAVKTILKAGGYPTTTNHGMLRIKPFRKSADRIVFNCPCGHRNNQSVLKALSLPEPGLAEMQCVMCRRIVHVRKSAIVKPKIQQPDGL